LSQTKSNMSFIYIVALICLISVALFMFSKSDFFLVKDIRFEGLSNVAENEVLKLSGTVKGENIFLVDTGALAARVKLHPLIEQAEVQKKYPGTLIVKVSERLPAALVNNNDAMVEVDSEGIILRFYDTWPQKDRPVITGVEVPETLGPGQKIPGTQLEHALLLIGQAPADLKVKIGEIHTEEGQINIFLITGIEVRLGYGDDYSGKLSLLMELLESTDFKILEKAIKYIDLTAGKPVLGR